MKNYIGVDIGSSTVKAAVIDEAGNCLWKDKLTHFGKTDQTALEMLAVLKKHYGGQTPVIFTGAGSRRIFGEERLAEDVPAIQKGAQLLFPQARTVLEIGAQNVRFLTGIGEKKPPQFAVNENCAGGTGAFFEDQMQRLGLPLESYSDMIKEAAGIPRLSGRCSVFAKTDIIHRQQEGVPTPDILLGLCYATVRNIKAVIVKNLPVRAPVVLGGGILHNAGVVRAVRDIWNLEEGELLSGGDCEYLQAIGAAWMLRQQKQSSTYFLKEAAAKLEKQSGKAPADSILRLRPLVLGGAYLREPECRKFVPDARQRLKCSLGIDVGSTSTNLVLTDTEGNLIDYLYLRTRGNPEQAVKDGLKTLQERYGSAIEVSSTGVTGSGRCLIGKMLGAVCVKDEITAQAKAAFCACEEADTVFEIGGQDSKYIRLEQGNVVDFQMNKICAAGTGSFIEEQAGRLKVPIDEYGERALTAKAPVDLGERCTVFIESNINNCYSLGVPTEDILAGLCYSVIYNYVHKVVGNKPVGEHIVLQGGVCYNAAVVAAFQSVYGNRAVVSPYFSVSGAYGAARLAAEEVGLKKTDVQIGENQSFYRKSKELFLNGYTRQLRPGKTVIGIPYALLVHKFFPLFRTYFEALGFQVLLSPESDEEIIALAQKYAQAETCFPVKLIFGHMKWLAENGADYIFMPSVLTMKHEKSRVYHNYGCVYMQTAPEIVFETLKLKEKGICLLNPKFSLDFGQQAMAKEMIQTGVLLGCSPESCKEALLKGSAAVRRQDKETELLGNQMMSDLKPDEKVLVLVTRNYGISDPVLNMGIPEELLRRGYKVLTLSHLLAHNLDISEEYSNLYWPFGQHIISGAKIIAAHPNLYAVYLTNHGCGPDTMLSHLFKKEMEGKPYLSIEVDEQFSKVGVITRIEAFLNSISQHQAGQKKQPVPNLSTWKLQRRKVCLPSKIRKEQPLYLPYLYPYSQVIAGQLRQMGFRAEILSKASDQSISLGRKYAMTKEYLPFTALIGAIMQQKENRQGNTQYLIPQTEGSEADGMYARVIYDYLQTDAPNALDVPDTPNASDVSDTVVTVTLETMPWKMEPKAFKAVFYAILGCDIVMASSAREREKMLQRLMAAGKLNMEKLLELAGDTADTGSTGGASGQFCTAFDKKPIALVGDPVILYDSRLHENLVEEEEKKGLVFRWMPLSEYLACMWKKRAETRPQIRRTEACIQDMLRVSAALGDRTTFSEDPALILQKASERLPSVTGANMAYRMGKRCCSAGCGAVLELAPMYENAQTILNLKLQNPSEQDETVPVLSLNFEGGNAAGEMQKLQSFLYYY